MTYLFQANELKAHVTKTTCRSRWHGDSVIKVSETARPAAIQMSIHGWFVDNTSLGRQHTIDSMLVKTSVRYRCDVCPVYNKSADSNPDGFQRIFCVFSFQINLPAVKCLKLFFSPIKCSANELVKMYVGHNYMRAQHSMTYLLWSAYYVPRFKVRLPPAP